jgi:hypothetical protein
MSQIRSPQEQRKRRTAFPLLVSSRVVNMDGKAAHAGQRGGVSRVYIDIFHKCSLYRLPISAHG